MGAGTSLEAEIGTRSQFPLADYAIIGDCRSAAMISKWGSIDWLCLPDFNSPSLFAALLDPAKGGSFQITLINAKEANQRYLPNTAVLETTLRSPEGMIRITDCMPVIEDVRHSKNLQPLREVLRRVEILEGQPVLDVALCVRPGYGAHDGKFRCRGKLGWVNMCGKYFISLISNFPFGPDGEILQARHNPRAGDVFWFSMTLEQGNPAVLMPIDGKSDERIESTAAWWRKWTQSIKYDGDYSNQILRSAITLRLLTFTLSGALLAAATTSLPEKIGGGMNWDYRYCWPRDSALAIIAFMGLGLNEEVGGFFYWLMLASSTSAPRLHVMYDVYGNYRVNEKTLNYLSGYKNSRPVRIGNQLKRQVQHDVTGEVLLAVENRVARIGKPPSYACKIIGNFGKATAKHWREPDNGIWEIRDKRRHYTYSKVMAWSVFATSLRLAKQKIVTVPENFYTSESDALRDMIDARGFNKARNSFTSVLDGDRLDASLLLLPRCGYLSYNDPRMIGTWQAIQEDLEEDGLIRRYPEGFGQSEPGEGAFVICNFWAVDYLTGAGRLDEAEERLTRLVKLSNDAGIYSECIDAKTHAFLGNMPQSFSHAGLINSILMLNRAKKGEKMDKAA